MSTIPLMIRGLSLRQVTISEGIAELSPASIHGKLGDKRGLWGATKSGQPTMQSFPNVIISGRLVEFTSFVLNLKLRNLFCYRAAQGLDKLLNGSDHGVCISFRNLVAVLGRNNVNQVLKLIYDNHIVVSIGIGHCLQ